LTAPDGQGEESPYESLPHGAEFYVATRRTIRTGVSAGEVVEDRGIRPDYFYRLTRQDLLEDNVDLIEEAGRRLAQEKVYTLVVTYGTDRERLPQAHIRTQNLTRLDIFVNGRPWGSFDVQDDVTEVDLSELVSHATGDQLFLRILGYDGNKLVVNRSESVPH
jgi:hypothetical protein